MDEKQVSGFFGTLYIRTELVSISVVVGWLLVGARVSVMLADALGLILGKYRLMGVATVVRTTVVGMRGSG